jgi:hypothetical protein
MVPGPFSLAMVAACRICFGFASWILRPVSGGLLPSHLQWKAPQGDGVWPRARPFSVRLFLKPLLLPLRGWTVAVVTFRSPIFGCAQNSPCSCVVVRIHLTRSRYPAIAGDASGATTFLSADSPAGNKQQHSWMRGEECCRNLVSVLILVVSVQILVHRIPNSRAAPDSDSRFDLPPDQR